MSSRGRALALQRRSGDLASAGAQLADHGVPVFRREVNVDGREENRFLPAQVRLEGRLEGVGGGDEGRPGVRVFGRGAYSLRSRDEIVDERTVRRVLGVHLRERGVDDGGAAAEARHEALLFVADVERERLHEVTLDAVADVDDVRGGGVRVLTGADGQREEGTDPSVTLEEHGGEARIGAAASERVQHLRLRSVAPVASAVDARSRRV